MSQPVIECLGVYRMDDTTESTITEREVRR